MITVSKEILTSLSGRFKEVNNLAAHKEASCRDVLWLVTSRNPSQERGEDCVMVKIN